MAKHSPNQERLKEVARVLREYEESNRAIMNSDASPLKPQRIMKEVSEALGPNDVVVSDTGFMLCWSTAFLDAQGNRLDLHTLRRDIGFQLRPRDRCILWGPRRSTSSESNRRRRNCVQSRRTRNGKALQQPARTTRSSSQQQLQPRATKAQA